jgi:hypothetical protein
VRLIIFCWKCSMYAMHVKPNFWINFAYQIQNLKNNYISITKPSFKKHWKGIVGYTKKVAEISWIWQESIFLKIRLWILSFIHHSNILTGDAFSYSSVIADRPETDFCARIRSRQNLGFNTGETLVTLGFRRLKIPALFTVSHTEIDIQRKDSNLAILSWYSQS